MKELQSVLPAEFIPVVIRRIRSFLYAASEDWDSFIGQTVRLSILGNLHDAYVVYEDVSFVIVLAKCGASLRIPREDLGGMAWSIGIDTNPHSAKLLSAEWVNLVTERPRLAECGSIEVHYSEADSRSTHRRIRCFALNEEKRNPCRPPFFVYCKFYFPSLLLSRIPPMPDNYMREAAAYRLVPLCQPGVAPICHYANFNEETGSYAIVLEDMVNYCSWVPIPKVAPNPLIDDRVPVELYMPNLHKLMCTLAVLHGRFLPKIESVDEKRPLGGDASVIEDDPQKDLFSVMIHAKVFYSTLKDALDFATGGEDVYLENLLDKVYGCCDPIDHEEADEKAITEGTTATESVSTTDTPHHQPQQPQHIRPAPGSKPGSRMDSRRTPPPSEGGGTEKQSTYGGESGIGGGGREFLVYPKNMKGVEDFHPCAQPHTSLTLIHGRILPEHIVMTEDPKKMPNLLLLDWKYSGIGPLEIDLLQALMLIPVNVRKANPNLILELLDSYVDTLAVFYGLHRHVLELLCRMRDVALIFVGLGSSVGRNNFGWENQPAPHDWTNEGKMIKGYAQLHVELAERTTKNQIKLKKKEMDVIQRTKEQ